MLKQDAEEDKRESPTVGSLTLLSCRADVKRQHSGGCVRNQDEGRTSVRP